MNSHLLNTRLILSLSITPKIDPPVLASRPEFFIKKPKQLSVRSFSLIIFKEQRTILHRSSYCTSTIASHITIAVRDLHLHSSPLIRKLLNKYIHI